MSNSAQFYANLPVIESFFDASNPKNFHRLPDNWLVAVTDIVDSTQAIQNDRYKEVNILGASPIVAIFNLAGRNEIPFTFGGDGSTFCVPPCLRDETKQILGASKKIGQVEYDLDLRAALIPVSYIRDRGHNIQVARYQASEYYTQAVFSGGGLSFAEDLLKKSAAKQFSIPTLDDAEQVDFSGLECRWQEVKQPQNEVITMLVQANPALNQSEKIYPQVLQKMRATFGFDDKTNPINTSGLTMNLSPTKLMGEAKIRTYGRGWIKRMGYILKVQLQTIIGKILMALGYKTSATNWELYKSDLAMNSDHRKFDDMLRVVISGSTSQRQEFVNFLDQKYKEGALAYGIHLSNAAMITCMVFEYHRDHIHFVDGSGGGYVSAAKQLKERLHNLSQD
ncbi:DUF3095 domain-containing protein [Fodinibius sp. Rm-B-1B1-1]|uniref:DUF3095 domain-containing protein n=1 Tax=Fodinibius alkaliphilus TaxID=3140241 RepID=UPI00315B2C13